MTLYNTKIIPSIKIVVVFYSNYRINNFLNFAFYKLKYLFHQSDVILIKQPHTARTNENIEQVTPTRSRVESRRQSTISAYRLVQREISREASALLKLLIVT